MRESTRVSAKTARRLPVGGELGPVGAHFRVWAPDHGRVDAVLESGGALGTHALESEGSGYFSGIVEGARAGDLYRYRLDGSDELYPDPASRSQPQGPHGPSAIVDPSKYAWTDDGWPGPDVTAAVVYELHVGAFTAEGTWAAAARELPALAELGITIVEVMPVAEFPGRFGWGYDGVDLFAPTHLYGPPDDFRAFVDSAHRLGIGVILDVVYNHLGPDGCYLGEFARAYFTDRYANEWGEALNFDGENAAPVREYFLSNARYWIDEFHLDGLRLDATQQIFDASVPSIVTEVGRVVREAAGGRATFTVAENEPQDVRLVLPVAEGGSALDAVWNDDFHHACRVAATGRREAYMSDYRGTAQELLSAVKFAFLFQGQRCAWQGKGRGSRALGVSRRSFVNYLQNHDQVANTPGGRRLCNVTSPGSARALAALLLLAPETPMLFMGEEYAASTPFYYFADHGPDLAPLVRRGRREFLSQFPGNTVAGADLILPDPAQPATFEASRLRASERHEPAHAAILALHRDLLHLRRDDPVFAAPLDGAVLDEHAFVVRWLDDEGDDRLLALNLGADLVRPSLAEPLAAPPPGREWRLRWASEHPAYGGTGQAEPVTRDGWRLSGHSAVLLAAIRVTKPATGPGAVTTEMRGEEGAAG